MLGAYITLTCHGTWLYRDGRGSVVPSDAERKSNEVEKTKAYFLDEVYREIALKAIIEIAAKIAWKLWAAHVRSNHVHVMVSTNAPVERFMNDVETAISRRLNKAFPVECNWVRWTRHGSTRYLWRDDQIRRQFTRPLRPKRSRRRFRFSSRMKLPSRAHSVLAKRAANPRKSALSRCAALAHSPAPPARRLPAHR